MQIKLEKGSPKKVLKALLETPVAVSLFALVYIVITYSFSVFFSGNGDSLWIQAANTIGFYVGFLLTWWVGFYSIYLWLRKLCKTEQSKIMLSAIWLILAALVVAIFIYPMFAFNSID
ncbi:MAG: hypothetical protein WCT32_03285 [Patescibacteria group bacterium]|jgi:hypothetical protein